MPYRGISCKDEREANEIENFNALFAVRTMYDDGGAQEGGEMFYYFPGSCYFSLSLSPALPLSPSPSFISFAYFLFNFLNTIPGRE